MDRDTVYLLDILTSARLIRTYVEGVARNEFLQDMKLQDSVIRRLGIIGEAAGKISPRFRENNPCFPWGEIRGMRNRMIHRYDDIDVEIVWETIKRDIPHLIQLIEPLAPLVEK